MLAKVGTKETLGSNKAAGSRAVALVGGGGSPGSPVSPPRSRRNTKGSRVGTKDGTQSAISDRSANGGEGSSSSGAGSDKFLVGIIGATIVVLQVVLVIVGLTSWIKVENQEMLDQLASLGLK
eukprot:TRINITY_DN3448_c0_g1_i1.p1 TRINITY_DN3448_c0_g1~~TRINITY_DN3448_c0_g1_i1.p1  ORF type:complete len:123 (-),score=17.92 TRINITY_DN3448_c0_g1_i1:113-481(-)